MVCLINHDQHNAVTLRRGDRIAQLIVQKVEQVVFDEVPQLPESQRGAGGYGSTGGHESLVAPITAALGRETEV